LLGLIALFIAWQLVAFFLKARKVPIPPIAIPGVLNTQPAD